MSDADQSIFDVPPDPRREEESWAEAQADIEAGRFVPHGEVAKWLATWGKEPRTAMPEEWLK